jgi:hypothetical protein
MFQAFPSWIFSLAQSTKSSNVEGHAAGESGINVVNATLSRRHTFKIVALELLINNLDKFGELTYVRGQT